MTSRNCSDMFASFVVQFTKCCELLNSSKFIIYALCGKIDKAIIICAEMRELIHT